MKEKERWNKKKQFESEKEEKNQKYRIKKKERKWR